MFDTPIPSPPQTHTMKFSLALLAALVPSAAAGPIAYGICQTGEFSVRIASPSFMPTLQAATPSSWLATQRPDSPSVLLRLPQRHPRSLHATRRWGPAAQPVQRLLCWPPLRDACISQASNDSRSTRSMYRVCSYSPSVTDVCCSR
jgi:hypothetical protein